MLVCSCVCLTGGGYSWWSLCSPDFHHEHGAKVMVKLKVKNPCQNGDTDPGFVRFLPCPLQQIIPNPPPCCSAVSRLCVPCLQQSRILHPSHTSCRLADQHC
ncbi:hypothetical protein CgunFtcFv8_000062 [Champsocephalus gunnari]|uniref:Uncharacterized protein n=1 Tax=Champsocephalus gunnari TaxID=52237 RepID=A0AAN8DHR8_CHAGU|nr:hypothetical protein CgunFtcFv8_000062 [Champsocephalus gunnari]